MLFWQGQACCGRAPGILCSSTANRALKTSHISTLQAISCLKRAAYLAPFEWMIAFNLGLVHLATDQLVSAFHFFNTAANLKPGFAAAHAMLGLTLYRLDDGESAKQAFAQARSAGWRPGQEAAMPVQLVEAEV